MWFERRIQKGGGGGGSAHHNFLGIKEKAKTFQRKD